MRSTCLALRADASTLRGDLDASPRDRVEPSHEERAVEDERVIGADAQDDEDGQELLRGHLLLEEDHPEREGPGGVAWPIKAPTRLLEEAEKRPENVTGSHE